MPYTASIPSQWPPWCSLAWIEVLTHCTLQTIWLVRVCTKLITFYGSDWFGSVWVVSLNDMILWATVEIYLACLITFMLCYINVYILNEYWNYLFDLEFELCQKLKARKRTTLRLSRLWRVTWNRNSKPNPINTITRIVRDTITRSSRATTLRAKNPPCNSSSIYHPYRPDMDIFASFQ